LSSILRQTYQDFEVIIVDDGSTDGSHNVLLEHQRRYPNKISYYRHPSHGNMGISATLNLAIRKSQGHYLAWLGSDDSWYPDKLERQVALMGNNPRIGLTYGRARIIDETGRETGQTIGVDISADPSPLERLIQGNELPALTVMVRRECIDKVGAFDESLVFSDWELGIRILAHWDPAFLDRDLGMYRIHGRNISIGLPPQVDLRHRMAVMSRLRQKTATLGGALANPRVQAVIDLQLVYQSFCLGDMPSAAAHLASAFETDASLSSDERWFDRWLASREAPVRHFLGGTISPRAFGLWAVTHLPRTVDRSFRRQLRGSQLARAACDYYRDGNPRRTMGMLVRYAMNDPFHWARRRDVLQRLIDRSIGRQTVA
jgi:cellulose synthase/poly-beta-1,6-N-acetylglucosamine synthase-like glycosyltransferase